MKTLSGKDLKVGDIVKDIKPGDKEAVEFKVTEITYNEIILEYHSGPTNIYIGKLDPITNKRTFSFNITTLWYQY